MPKMISIVNLYYTPVIDLSDLSEDQAQQFFHRCASCLDHISVLFFDNLGLDEHGQLFTNTPLSADQLEKFISEMGLENVKN